MKAHRVVAALVAAAALSAVLVSLADVTQAWARAALPLALLVFAGALVYGAAGGPGSMRVGLAMFRRTFLSYRSYRFQVVSILAWTALTVVLLYLAAGPLFRLLLGVETEPIPGALVAILTVGMVTWPVFWKSWEVTALGVRQDQWEGTFEPVVPMPNGTRSLPFGYLMSRLPFTLTFQFFSLTAIMLALPGTLRLTSPRAALDFVAVLILAVATMWGLGLLFGGLAILYKQLGPVDLVIRTLLLFLSGVFLPVEIYPAWLQRVAEVLPLTHAYKMLHSLAVVGTPIGEWRWSLLVVLAWATAAVVAGNAVYHAYVDKARSKGAIQGY